MNNTELFLKIYNNDVTIKDGNIPTGSTNWTIGAGCLRIFNSMYYCPSTAGINVLEQDISYFPDGNYSISFVISPSWSDVSNSGTITVDLCNLLGNVLYTNTYGVNDFGKQSFIYNKSGNNIQFLKVSYAANTNIGICSFNINTIDFSNEYVDLYDNIDIETTFNIEDLEDITCKYADYSYSFDVPGTEHNNKLFSHTYKVPVSGTFELLKKYEFYILKDGIQVISGIFNVESVEVSSIKIYKCSIKSNLMQLYDNIGNKTLVGNDNFADDLDFGIYKYIRTQSALLNKIDPTVADPYGTGSRCILIDKKGRFERNTTGQIPYEHKEFSDFLYIAEVLTQIIEKAGFILDSDFISGIYQPSGFNFQQLILPECRYNKIVPASIIAELNNVVGVFGESLYAPPFDSDWTVVTDISTGVQLFKPDNYASLVWPNAPVSYTSKQPDNFSRYTITENPSLNLFDETLGYYKCEVTGTYKVDLDYTFFPYFEVVDPHSPACVYTRIYKNSDDVLTIGGQLWARIVRISDATIVGTFEVSTFGTATGDLDISNYPYISLGTCVYEKSLNVYLEAGENYAINFYWELTYANRSDVQIPGDTVWGWLYDGFVGSSVAISAPLHFVFYTKTNFANNKYTFRYSYVGGADLIDNLYDPTWLLQADVKQADFLTSIIKMFNMYNKRNNGNILKLEPYNYFYEETDGLGNYKVGTKDWTDKVDFDSFLIERDSQLLNTDILFKYKKDADFLTNNYYEATGKEYGQYSKTDVQNTQKNEMSLIFAPAVSAIQDANNQQFILPHIYSKPEWKETNSGWTFTVDEKFVPSHRILYYTKDYDFELTKNIYAFSVSAPIGVNLTTFFSGHLPYAGMFDLPVNENIDLGFHDNLWYYPPEPHSYNNWATWNNLYNLFYKDKYDLYTNSNNRIVSFELILSTFDIHNYQYNDVIWIDGVKYRCVEIDGWKNSYEPVKCTFIKL